MNATGEIQKGRYHCKFSGCDKSFQRREHLARHARTHSESKYVCNVCQKEFTRSDSLQRHLGLHGEAFKPSPSGRSKRACQTCHASKIKCNGEQPCSRCHKKGIDCHYDHINSDIQKEASKGSTPAPIMFGYRVSREEIDDDSAEAIAPTSGDNPVETQASFEERLAAALNRNRGPIDWTSAKVRNDLPPRPEFCDAPYGENQSPSNGIWPALAKSETSKFMKLYFSHFHHRWPVLHAPTFEEETAPPVLLSCVAMIGAFIHATNESMELAIDLQNRVFDHIIPRLTQFSSNDSIDHASTLSICEASLLYIVLGLHCGKETILSKSIIVRSLLVTTLREIGLFNPELPVPYDKPDYFLPLRFVKEAQKQRLSTCLFKVDAYLSILRGQPALLAPEELHFTLPSTFALWNAHGLNIWETRHSVEPTSRGQTTIRRTICEPSLESLSPADGLMLIEDIQLGICAMHNKSWHLRERIRDDPDQEIGNSIEIDALKRRFDAWKHLINQSPIQQTDHLDFSQDQHLAMRYYYGIEDHSDPGWQLIVFDRPKNLIFDTMMLYHLLNMHLFADIRTLNQLAKDKHPTDPMNLSGEIHLKAKERREMSIRKWVESASVRRALCHATDVLFSCNNISGHENSHVDPIAFVALSVGALIVWACCMFDGKGCPDCVSEEAILPAVIAPITELTKWSGPRSSQVLDKNRETWIEMGDSRGAITGLPLCRCNINLLLAKFRGCIRQGWDVADMIAPSIFKIPI